MRLAFLGPHHNRDLRRVAKGGRGRVVGKPRGGVPSQWKWVTVTPGLARDCHFTGFPEFEQFCIADFPASTQVGLSPLRLPVPPRSHSAVTYTWPSQSGQSCRGGFAAVSDGEQSERIEAQGGRAEEIWRRMVPSLSGARGVTWCPAISRREQNVQRQSRGITPRRRGGCDGPAAGAQAADVLAVGGGVWAA